MLVTNRIPKFAEIINLIAGIISSQPIQKLS